MTFLHVDLYYLHRSLLILLFILFSHLTTYLSNVSILVHRELSNCFTTIGYSIVSVSCHVLNQSLLKDICCLQTYIINLTHILIQTLHRYICEIIFEKRNRRVKCICIFIFEIYFNIVQHRGYIPTSNAQQCLSLYKFLNRAF